MSISVIVPTHNRARDLHIALDSLNNQTCSPPFEAIVVDNASTDTTAATVQQAQSVARFPVRYYHEVRPGLHRARHAGACLAGGDILVYADDDIRAEPGWLAAISRPFADPKVGIVAGRILPEWAAPPPDWVSRFHPSYWSLLDLGDQPLELDWPAPVYGCNFAVRKSLLSAVGGFNPDGFADPALRWYRGDGETGLAQKVYSAGHRLVYEPAACVRHRIPPSRLTAAYCVRRGFVQGVSTSYARIRSRHFPETAAAGRSPGSQPALARRLACLALACLRVDPGAWIEVRARLAYLYGLWGHRWWTASNPAHRRYVLTGSYLDP